MSTDKYQRLRDAIAAGPTPGPWIHLFGDRFIYTRLEDGCRGTPVVGVDYASAGTFPTLKYIATADPDTIAELLAERDRLHAALAVARHYVAKEIFYRRIAFRGYESLGKVQEAEADLARIDAALGDSNER